MPFGKKAKSDFNKFAKKLGVKRDFGRKLVNTVEKAGSVVSRIADVATLINPELAPVALGVKGISRQAGGLAQSGVSLTGKRPDLAKIGEQIASVKQSAKDIKGGLQRAKPAGEESGLQFTD
jgi:hypothetical protein